MKAAIARFDQITFRHIPDPQGDAATFLNFFLPDEKTARKVVEAFNDAGIIGLQYWYDNNFHYIKNWHHLKDFSVAAKLPVQVIDPERNYSKINLPKSDNIMSRLVSLVISVSWTAEDLNQHIDNITTALDKVLR